MNDSYRSGKEKYNLDHHFRNNLSCLLLNNILSFGSATLQMQC